MSVKVNFEWTGFKSRHNGIGEIMRSRQFERWIFGLGDSAIAEGERLTGGVMTDIYSGELHTRFGHRRTIYNMVYRFEIFNDSQHAWYVHTGRGGFRGPAEPKPFLTEAVNAALRARGLGAIEPIIS